MVIERRLRDVVKISDNQFDFMPRSATIKLICALRQLVEKYTQAQKDIEKVSCFANMITAPQAIIWPKIVSVKIIRNTGVNSLVPIVLLQLYSAIKTGKGRGINIDL